MPKRINELTQEQRDAMPEWARMWIEIGLKTGPTTDEDRERVEQAIAVHYEAAGLPQPKHIVWVPSPLVGALAAPIAGALSGSVYDAVGGVVYDAVGDAVGGVVDRAVHDAVGDAVGGVVGDVVDRAVHGVVDRAVHDAVGDAVGIGGQFWVGGWWHGCAAQSYLVTQCGLDIGEDMERRLFASCLMAMSCAWWWPHRDFVMVCERPSSLSRDEQGRLHSLSGPSIAWEGWELHHVHGVRVPEYVVARPEEITVEKIEAEANAEVRRVMVERYGLARYVRDAQFSSLDSDRDPLGQPRRLLRRGEIVVVELTNSTIDADGTRRVYHVPCHPELRPLLPDGELGEPQRMTALNAVASTYGMRGEEYVLAEET